MIDPTQAPPGKHTTYCWHVMPLEPELNGQNYEDFKTEFADKIIEPGPTLQMILNGAAKVDGNGQARAEPNRH